LFLAVKVNGKGDPITCHSRYKAEVESCLNVSAGWAWVVKATSHPPPPLEKSKVLIFEGARWKARLFCTSREKIKSPSLNWETNPG
jgi:hypothetical protein